MKFSYFGTLLFLFCLLTTHPLSAQEDKIDYTSLPAFQITSLPQNWFDINPVYKEPKLLLYLQEFTYTCSTCHEKDLKAEPKKSHLPFGAHKDMFFTHGLNLRCLNCHHADHPDAFTDHDGSIIPQDKPVLLCRKCHGVTYREWQAGIHGRVNGFWSIGLGSQKNVECNQCHNPHHPKFPALKPMPPPVRPAAYLPEEDKHHE